MLLMLSASAADLCDHMDLSTIACALVGVPLLADRCHW